MKSVTWRTRAAVVGLSAILCLALAPASQASLRPTPKPAVAAKSLAAPVVKAAKLSSSRAQILKMRRLAPQGLARARSLHASLAKAGVFKKIRDPRKFEPLESYSATAVNGNLRLQVLLVGYKPKWYKRPFRAAEYRLHLWATPKFDEQASRQLPGITVYYWKYWRHVNVFASSVARVGMRDVAQLGTNWGRGSVHTMGPYKVSLGSVLAVVVNTAWYNATFKRLDNYNEAVVSIPMVIPLA